MPEPPQSADISVNIERSAKFLAIDLGAESGRAVVGSFDGTHIQIEEIGRFPTSMGQADLCSDGVQRWDIQHIKTNIDSFAAKAVDRCGQLSGIGVDSWGVDVGFFDSNGKLLSRPACYRDDSHAMARSSVFERMSEREIWDATGIQSMPFNTLYQIEALKIRQPEILERAREMLLIPDVLHTLLVDGDAKSNGAEVTDASTSQMMKPGAVGWNTDLLKKLGLPIHFLGPITTPGSKFGISRESRIPIYAPATHDTASAVAATPASSDSKNWAFLSSGTWSLIGVELQSPVMTYEAMSAGFSNEAGVAGTIRFLKNIMGLWLLQKCRQNMTNSGTNYSYAELTEMAKTATAGAVIDATDERLLNPPNMIAAISQLCDTTGQSIPSTAGELARCCMESLAMAYRLALREVAALTGRTIERLHVVGGGSQNELLNQWTADACGIDVIAGPVEAAAVGNILGQMVGDGKLANWDDARELSSRSFTPRVYTPRSQFEGRWEYLESTVCLRWSGKSR